jgi:hypothetical protein
MDRRTRASVVAACLAVASVYAHAAPRVACDGLVGALAMGPDPGGKTDAGVTPETTRTDHPAAGGPLPETERKTESKPVDDPREEREKPAGGDGRKGSRPSSGQSKQQ